MLPNFRTQEYSIWRACERLGILPPSIKHSWDDNHPWLQCMIIGYNQVRELEEHKILEATLSVPRL